MCAPSSRRTAGRPSTCRGTITRRLAPALDAPRTGRPRALVAHTTFGYGVSFMESTIAWHYLPLSTEQHATAIAELEARA